MLRRFDASSFDPSRPRGLTWFCFVKISKLHTWVHPRYGYFWGKPCVRVRRMSRRTGPRAVRRCLPFSSAQHKNSKCTNNFLNLEFLDLYRGIESTVCLCWRRLRSKPVTSLYCQVVASLYYQPVTPHDCDHTRSSNIRM
jgi:hypothetical protein